MIFQRAALFLCSSLLFPGIATTVAATLDVTDADVKHSASIISWLKTKKGYFNPKLEMRRIDPSDPTSIFGMFAKEDISEGSLMVRIPNDVVLHSKENGEPKAMDCGLVHNLIDQLRLKNDSEYAPYVNYLLETQPPGQLPSAWSKPGKELLMQLLGHQDFSLDEAMIDLNEGGDLNLRNILPPMDPIGWIEHEWYGDCNGSDDPQAQYAALQVVQRAWDDILIPIYDMINHRNGDWLNTKSDESGVHSGEPVVVKSKRDIKAGEQIYSTYNMCEDCGARITTYGTSEVLRDYGFVEQYPQTWIFPDLDLGFRIDEGDEDADGNQLYILTEWIDEEPDEEDDMDALQEKLAYVVQQKNMLDNRSAYPDVLDIEWDMMVQYMDAMDLGVRVALQWFDEVNEEHSCVTDGSCTVSLDRYTDLDITYKTVNEEYYSAKTCDIQEQFKVFDDDTFVEIDEFKSQYQQINFMWNPIDRDTCMDLDDTVQICDAYRPHYHEYAVHQTARFLPKDSIKRVLFVGGGDSMLLHETLKYPSLELVVGLELDQKVTRGCFKHFGTQPHFHDNRVEWWFGDAAKSLLMLPKDYFASFDLVLVDLSETVMSFKVTEELDVIEALSLLVKPDGIFVKNEVYFEKFKEMFPYTAQVNWYDNPIICSQVMVMGSRTVDFMNPTLTEHGTSNLVIRDLEKIEDHFDLYHDYAYNATSFHLCDTLADKKNDATQVRSPGILMAVEAEDVTGDISGDNLKTNLSRALEKEGFNVISSDIVETDSNVIAYITLKEGYVIARAMAELKYVGFDIHLWSTIHKHEAAKDALVVAIGGNASALSTYRVIAGGMFGMDTWKEDDKLRGPQFEEMCHAIKETAPAVNVNDGDTSQTDLDIVMEEGLKVLDHDQDLKLAMLVGNDDSSKDAAEKHRATLAAYKSVKEVVSMNCPSMVDFNEFSEEAGDALAACEKYLYEIFDENTNDDKFNVIVIDSTADMVTSSILLKLFAARRKQFLGEVLEEDVIIISTIVDNEDEAWKRNLLLLFKDEVFSDAPTMFTEVIFENSETNSEFSLLLTNGGGTQFIGNLNATLVEFKKGDSNSLTGRVEVINGGEWLYQKDFIPSRTYLPDDYDQSGPLAQWETQHPTGHQFIIQLEPDHKSPKKIKMTDNLLMKATVGAINKANLPGLDASFVKNFTDVGEGCLLVALWEGGSLAILWDGRSHVDVNLFTYVEDIKIGDGFVKNFLRAIPSFTTMLRDEQPRGTGRNVAYQRDLKGNTVPHWA